MTICLQDEIEFMNGFNSESVQLIWADRQYGKTALLEKACMIPDCGCTGEEHA